MANIGVFRVGSLGDHLIALPLYRRLREFHAQDSLHLIGNSQMPGNSKLLGPADFLPPLFDHFHAYRVGSGRRALLEKRTLFRRLKLSRLYYLMPERSQAQIWRDRMFFFACGIRVVGMQGRAQRRQFNPAEDLYEHELDRLSRLALQLGSVNKSSASVSLDITEAEIRTVRGLLDHARGTVCVSIGAKLEVKDWGEENWCCLVAQLADLTQIEQLVFVGAADEYEYSERVRAHWPRTSFNFCGQLPPRLSAAVMKGTMLLIGHDSGPMHMAAAVGVPVVAIFASISLPGAWYPLTSASHVHFTRIKCMGCGRLTCHDLDKRCIRDIGVDSVFASVKKALS